MTRFADQHYITAFNDTGEYPHIHDAIAATVRVWSDGRNALDLGACTGLLAHRCTAWCPEVVALEPNPDYMHRGMSHPRVTWINQGIRLDSLPALAQIIVNHDIELVIARRVFPEIGPVVTAAASLVMAAAGVNRIILEGRRPSSRATDPMPSADHEVRALSPAFTMTHRNGHVRVLDRNPEHTPT